MRSHLILAASAATALVVLLPMTEAVAQPADGSRQARLTGTVQRLASSQVGAASRVGKGGFTVSVPSSLTTFNKRKVRVAPTVRVRGGVNRQVTSRRLTVYSGKRRVASGRSVKLRIGTYRQSVTVRYIAYKFVVRHKTVTDQIYVPGGYPTGSTCTITAVSSSGSGSGNDVIDSATCRNREYPQATTASGYDLYDVPQSDGTENYVVGQQVSSSAAYFDGYTKNVRRVVAYKVRVNTGRGKIVTRRSRLVVKDGGYLEIWTGGDTSGGRIKFTTTQKSRWIYVMSCGDYGFFGVNWSTDDDYGSFGPDSAAPYGESSDIYRSRFVGRTEFHVFSSDCSWAIGVASKGKIKT